MAQQFTNINDIEQAIKIFEILAADEYSPIWWVIGDFTVNGHYVSVGNSTLWHHVIIDDRYVSLITGVRDCTNGRDVVYETAMDYIRHLLNEPVKEVRT